jgi:ATP-dependent DNA ligase
MLWDRGYWEIEGDLTPEQALAKGDFKFRVDGKKLKGSWVLVRLKRRDTDKNDNWLLIKHRDEHAVSSHGDKILADDKSVASGRTLEQIADGRRRYLELRHRKPRARTCTRKPDAPKARIPGPWHASHAPADIHPAAAL